jgi:hypothetical protein
MTNEERWRNPPPFEPTGYRWRDIIGMMMHAQCEILQMHRRSCRVVWEYRYGDREALRNAIEELDEMIDCPENKEDI